MPAPKRDHRPKRDKNQDLHDIGEIAVCVMEELNREKMVEVEPFEEYAQALTVRLLTQGLSFREHFLNGFKVLTDALKAE